MATFMLGCWLCGAKTECENYGDCVCSGCGLEYVYDEAQQMCPTGEQLALWNAAPSLIAQLAEALNGLLLGDCWCEVAIDNPMYQGKHTDACDAARAAIAEAEKYRLNTES